MGSMGYGYGSKHSGYDSCLAVLMGGAHKRRRPSELCVAPEVGVLVKQSPFNCQLSSESE